MKFPEAQQEQKRKASHPARGAWIEIVIVGAREPEPLSHPARGAWIEMGKWTWPRSQPESHPARGAWIEISQHPVRCRKRLVAPRKGCVD